LEKSSDTLESRAEIDAYDGLGVEGGGLWVVLELEGSVACFFEGLDWRFGGCHML